MNKPLCIVSCPIDVYSGYSSRSRDFVKSLIQLKKDEWDIKILPQMWGNCPFGFIEENPEWNFLNEYILPNPPQLSKQPEIWIQITVPNEFQPVGKFNIGITAGFETTLAPSNTIEGINRMDLTLVSSEHAKNTFLNSKYEKINNNTKQKEGILEVNKPIEVLFEGIQTNIFKYLEKPNLEIGNLNQIKEDFCYLFCSHWIGNTPIGEDRKNIGLLIKSFLEVFKNKTKKPALILKTSMVGSSYMDRNEILKRIEEIKKTVNSNNLPNIYLLHGEFTDSEMNEIYNHPKIKAMFHLAKGEGYGRTLLEFTLSKKPLIASNWSGQLDFLNKEFTNLIGGTLTPVHPSAANQFLLKEAQWFSPDHGQIGFYLKDVFENYKNYVDGGKRQSYYSKTNFSFEKMTEKLEEYLKRVPEFPKLVGLNLPPMKTKLNLPKLTKI